MSTVNELMKRNYKISLRWDNDERAYFASVDELPGLLADGRSANAAVKKLREAMRAWMESRQEAGLEIPAPRESAEFSGKTLVRMPKTLHKKLSEHAAYEGVSLNQYIVSALSETCGRASTMTPQSCSMTQVIPDYMDAITALGRRQEGIIRMYQTAKPCQATQLLPNQVQPYRAADPLNILGMECEELPGPKPWQLLGA